ncbi:hypothetical protein EW146_g2082 [Bondarzewia mesenterica]|uniref:Tyrosine specific protein phosphatases domain-containing protein n=1 Tax=Bondarzewia mesenterica TaxID=1095465 RepID=A0A4V3XFV4_9AGAM|nr:hypothetical protein EW146_g2082 [Bondarzewia mesenterica]
MTTLPSYVPSWLRNAHNNEHINSVLHNLAERERTRIRARADSQNRSNRSLVNRITRVPSTLSSRPSFTNHYSVAIASLPENLPFNRYSDIEPYDRTRVIVGDRYFNGSWVRECAGGNWAIATQAPLPTTVHEFLSIIAEPSVKPPDGRYPRPTRVRTVVQLTPSFESGIQKAHAYLPPKPGESWIIHPGFDYDDLPTIKIILVKSEAVDYAQCVVSTVSVEFVAHGVTRNLATFKHLMYTSWPDHGVPAPRDRAKLLEFIKLVDRTNKDISCYAGEQDLHPDPPVMVHCSAGVGRTGSFIALSSLLRSHGLLSTQPGGLAAPVPGTSSVPLLPNSPLGPLPQSLAWDQVAQEIDQLREQRPGMIQRHEQALLIYDVLILAFVSQGQA